MGTILSAILPIAVLIAMGSAMQRRGFVPEQFWRGAERLCFVFLLPALLFSGLATADFSGVPVGGMAASLALAPIVMCALLVVARPRLAVTDAAFTSVVQGSIRFNNYIALALASGLYPDQGLALASVGNAVVVPTVNVLTILVFARFGAARPTPRIVARMMATNPLLVSCLAGALLNALGITLPSLVLVVLRTLGQAALPIGLLCVGAGFQLSTLRSGPGGLSLAIGLKAVVMPALAAGGCAIFGVTGPAATITILFHALPTASTSYIMARQMGGDAPLMAAITTVQTLAAAVTIPMLLAVIG